MQHYVQLSDVEICHSLQRNMNYGKNLFSGLILNLCNLLCCSQLKLCHFLVMKKQHDFLGYVV